MDNGYVVDNGDVVDKGDVVEIPIFQVDAFTSTLFAGNPAAVMPLQRWLADEQLQAIAMENNLSETAFLVPDGQAYALRWFTPTVEIDLCGHATLASAHVLFEHLQHPANEILFNTRSGPLRVSRSESGLTMDFPARPVAEVAVSDVVCAALGATAQQAFGAAAGGNPLLYLYQKESQVLALAPDFAALVINSPYPVVVTAPGQDCDFVSRFFAPHVGIDEDPVTGSAHCCLVPLWAERLERTRLRARQLSARGGQLACELREGRVFMRGTAVTFMRGSVLLPQA